MSFQATHLHFAKQVQPLFKITDLTRYFSGVLYPDSRYLTDVAREKTHTDVRIFPAKIKSLEDDFQIGWQVHLWYDKLALPHLEKIGLGRPIKEEEMKNPDIWVQVTGAKLVEDLHWWSVADWKNILPYLKYTTNPNNEKPELLKTWYQYFYDFYRQKPNLADYEQQSAFMGIPADRAQQLLAKAQKIYHDQNKKQAAEQILSQVKTEFKLLI